MLCPSKIFSGVFTTEIFRRFNTVFQSFRNYIYLSVLTKFISCAINRPSDPENIKMNEFALHRLKIERSEWRKNHPFGFVAKPMKNLDGSLNYKVWVCRIPGLGNTFWGDGWYYLFMIFSDDYPFRPPTCRFLPNIFHPNVCKHCGTLRALLLNSHWSPEVSIQQILIAIQSLLSLPDPTNIANDLAYFLYNVRDIADYQRLIQWQAQRMGILENSSQV